MRKSTKTIQRPEATDTIGDRILFCRTKVDMTGDALANAVGTTKQAVSAWENDTRKPDIGTISKLCDALDCDADFLVRPEKQLAPRKPVYDASKMTGLSHESVEALSRWRSNHTAYIAKAIDALILYQDSLNGEDIKNHDLFAQINNYIHPPVAEKTIRISAIGRAHNVLQSSDNQPFSLIGREYSVDQLKRDTIMNTLTHIRDSGVVSKLKGVPGRVSIPDMSETKKN